MTIEEQPNVCLCGATLSDTGPSLYYCSQACQYRYMAKGYDPLPLPALPEWRMGWGGEQAPAAPPDPTPVQASKRGMIARLRAALIE